MKMYSFCSEIEFATLLTEFNFMDSRFNISSSKKRVDKIHLFNNILGILHFSDINPIIICEYEIPDYIINSLRSHIKYCNVAHSEEQCLAQYLVNMSTLKFSYLIKAYVVDSKSQPLLNIRNIFSLLAPIYDFRYLKSNIINLLSSGNVAQNIIENLDFFITLIPEIQSMIGFDHKHPHHHLDVWEHTLDVIRKLNTLDLELNTAALFHDIGKPFCYQEGPVRHFYGHPEMSEKIARHILLKLDFDLGFIDRVSYLVKTHDAPINSTQLDNDLQLIKKRLELQYADAKAHHPAKVEQRINKLDAISHALNIEPQ